MTQGHESRCEAGQKCDPKRNTKRNKKRNTKRDATRDTKAVPQSANTHGTARQWKQGQACKQAYRVGWKTKSAIGQDRNGKATGRARAAWRKRYYLKLTRGVFTDAEWKKLLNRFSGLCAYCETAKAEHREHVIPISRGGMNTAGNILPACPTCNLSKGTLTLMEWRLSGRAPEAMRPLTRRNT